MSNAADRFTAWLKGVAFRILFSPDMKRKLIASVNLKINIPILSEKDEQELFELIWDLMEEGFKKTLEEK